METSDYITIAIGINATIFSAFGILIKIIYTSHKKEIEEMKEDIKIIKETSHKDQLYSKDIYYKADQAMQILIDLKERLKCHDDE